MTESQDNESGRRQTEAIGTLFDLGWRQLSILPPELAEIAREYASPALDLDVDDLVVVASHDCDVCSPNENDEPHVELIALTRLEQSSPDGNLAHLKNPRRIQLPLEIDGRVEVCELRAHKRWWIPRRVLLGGEPRTQVETTPPGLVQRWLSRRYDRPAFPNAFVDRIKPVEDNIKSAMERYGNVITGVFVTISTMEELPPGKPYVVTVAGIMREEDWDDADQRDEVATVIDTVAAHMDDCSGIEVENSDLLSEAEVSLADLRRYLRLDYDTLSYRGRVAAPVPPTE